MATQTVAFPNDHQGSEILDLVRESSGAGARRPQPRAKLSTCRPPSQRPDAEINDSERIVRICAGLEEILKFIQTAKPEDSRLPISDETRHFEARTTLQVAVEELELLREHLNKREPGATRRSGSSLDV